MSKADRIRAQLNRRSVSAETVDTGIESKAVLIDHMGAKASASTLPSTASVNGMSEAVTNSESGNTHREATVKSDFEKHSSESTLRSESENRNPEALDTNESANVSREEKVEGESKLAKASETLDNGARGVLLVQHLQEQRRKRVTKADTHRRRTYEIRNELIYNLDKIAEKMKRGFKDDLINALLEDFFDELKKDKRWAKVLR